MLYYIIYSFLLEKSNIESAAAVTGGVVGFAVGGPILALIMAG